MNAQRKTQSGQSPAEPDRTGDTHEPVFYYRDSGILERHGKIPLWLVGVVVVLLVWGIYYLVAYWTPPS